ncbi:hypothetical protein SASPL_115165 [Salvia splendens]|uniref:Translation elongation factor EF1B beta/delta subunit guanine nucleotide exchange domain-containing protein n=1 Tax=Salvia splendens TaxID=180675 RepID=A0A8X8Y702_SALSN|nr:hypothetical protein SASPL_115165 [Salvia splendens]
MAVSLSDLSSTGGLKKLDEYLLTRTKPPSSDYVIVSRWFNHIDALLRISGVSGEGSGVSSSVTGDGMKRRVEPSHLLLHNNCRYSFLRIDEGDSKTESAHLATSYRGKRGKDKGKRILSEFSKGKRILPDSSRNVAGPSAKQFKKERSEQDDNLVILVPPPEQQHEEQPQPPQEHDEVVPLRRSTRVRRPAISTDEYIVYLQEHEVDIRVMEDDPTDMKVLEEKVRSVQQEGLLWGASKLVPVGYGIKKLQIMITIVDDLVSVDSLIEEYLTAEPINEYVQSRAAVLLNGRDSAETSQTESVVGVAVASRVGACRCMAAVHRAGSFGGVGLQRRLLLPVAAGRIGDVAGGRAVAAGGSCDTVPWVQP